MNRPGVRIAAALTAVLMLLAMTGCGSKDKTPEYPGMELIDLSELDLLAAEDDTIKYQVVRDEWIPGTDGSGAMVMMYADTMETEHPVNLAANFVGYSGEALEEEFANELVAELCSEPWMELQFSEMRTLAGEPILYAEAAFQYTDEIINEMLEDGKLTEESLAAAGGRETLLQAKADMIMICTVVDEYGVVYCGSYYEEDQKQIVIDGLNVMIQTTSRK